MLIATGTLSGTELSLIVLIAALTIVVPILVAIWIIRKLIVNQKENRRLRLEVSKLAHEMEQYRGRNPGASS
jgi:hypothetical protein